MPLTKTGKKVLNKMKRTYGKEKGKRVFYSMEHSHPEWTIKGKTRVKGHHRHTSDKKVWVNPHTRRR